MMMKAFRFRVYPTADQAARLDAWEGALRFLWNLAHEQRLMGLRTVRDRRRYYTAFDQQLELTDLRAEVPWLAEVPRNVCAQLLAELDKAWQRAFRKLASSPRFKKKGRDGVAICEPHPKTWSLVADGRIRFPKLGVLKTVMHRPLEGTPKTCSLVRDGDAWFASIVCEQPVEAPVPGTATGPAVALDRGVALLVADSDGRTVANPKHLQRSLKRLARAQRRVAKTVKGGKNREKAKRRVARIHRKVRRQRDHQLHVLSSHYAQRHGVVVVEDLNIRGMTKSAAGTKENPGKNVAAKSGLNRSILDAAWGRFALMLDYKLKWRGGVLLKVLAQYSSQTCAECEHVDANSRVSQAEFVCTSCGHGANADVNAARVLLSRGIHGAAACGGVSARKPAKQELRVARRGPRRRQGSSSSEKAPSFTEG
jgi:putative transposase